MKAWRRPPTSVAANEEPEIVEGPQEVAGWVAVSTGAVANVTSVLRWAAWAMLIAGPVLGVAAWLRPPAVAASVAQAVKEPVVVRDTAGPAGFAELYVAAYIEAGRGREASLQPYFPGMRDLTLEAAPGVEHAERLAAVQVKGVAGGYWSVTVATRVTSDAKKASKASKDTAPPKAPQGAVAGEVLRYFQVPVKAAASGGGYVAAALPAEVSAPAPGEPVLLDYGGAVPADTRDAATGAVKSFLAAYLAGAGELDRYLAPGTDLHSISPAPYEEVAVTELAEQGGDFEVQARATEGARRELFVGVEATAAGGHVRPLSYALQLTARDGRWEIAALTAAPTLSTTKGHS